MRYQPVKIVALFTQVFSKNSGRFLRETPLYYTVWCNMFGPCGHKHHTKKAAEPCLRRLKKLWHDARVSSSRAAHAQRRATAAFRLEVAVRKAEARL